MIEVQLTETRRRTYDVPLRPESLGDQAAIRQQIGDALQFPAELVCFGFSAQAPMVATISAEFDQCLDEYKDHQIEKLRFELDELRTKFNKIRALLMTAQKKFFHSPLLPPPELSASPENA